MSQNEVEKCPDTTTLSDYLLGQLEPPALEQCESHVADCDTCHQTLRGLSAEDTLCEHVAGAFLQATGSDSFSVDADAGVDADEDVHVRGLVDRLLSQTGNRSLGPKPSAAETEILADRAAEVLRCVQPDPNNKTLGSIGDYQLMRLIGAGSTGVVFQAIDQKLDRTVALKVLRPSLGSVARERFIAEARLAASIEHPNVVTIYQIDQYDRLAFIAMQWLPGQTLEAKLGSTATMADEEVRPIAAQVAAGLQAAHQRQLVHRDIKPANVWISDDEGVKILDFGLARIVNDDPGLTATGMLAGTPNFMSPEQTKGHELDGRSDLFSLGCMMYRMATGKCAFGATSILGTLQAIQHEHPTPPKFVNAEISNDLSDLTMNLLEKQPANRPESADQVVTMLEAERGQWPMKIAGYESPQPASQNELKLQAKRQGFGGRWVALLAASLLGLAGWGFAPQIIRIVNDQGELVIESEGKDIEVEILQVGKVVRVLDTKTQNSFNIESGEYQIKAAGDGNSFEVTPNALTMKRGQQTVVSVTKQQSPRESTASKTINDGTVGDTSNFRVYPVTTDVATTLQALSMLLEGRDGVRIVGNTKAGSIMVVGSEDDHQLVSDTLATLSPPLKNDANSSNGWPNNKAGQASNGDNPILAPEAAELADGSMLDSMLANLLGQGPALEERLAETQQDQRFAVRQLLSTIRTLKREQDVAAKAAEVAAATAERTKKSVQKGSTSFSELALAKLEVERANLQLASVDERLKIYQAVADEFGITDQENATYTAARNKAGTPSQIHEMLQGMVAIEETDLPVLSDGPSIDKLTKLESEMLACALQLKQVKNQLGDGHPVVQKLSKHYDDLRLMSRTEEQKQKDQARRKRAALSKPTYKGKPFAHWIKIVETERSTEMLSDALRAGAELVETAEEKAKLLEVVRTLARKHETSDLRDRPTRNRSGEDIRWQYSIAIIDVMKKFEPKEVVQFMLTELEHGTSKSVNLCGILVPSSSDLANKESLCSAMVEQAPELLRRIVLRLERAGESLDYSNRNFLVKLVHLLFSKGQDRDNRYKLAPTVVAQVKERNKDIAPTIRELFLKSSAATRRFLVQLTRAYWPNDEQVELALQASVFDPSTQPNVRYSVYHSIVSRWYWSRNDSVLLGSPESLSLLFLQKLLNNQLGANSQRIRFGRGEKVDLKENKFFLRDFSRDFKGLSSRTRVSNRDKEPTIEGRAVMVCVILNSLMNIATEPIPNEGVGRERRARDEPVRLREGDASEALANEKIKPILEKILAIEISEDAELMADVEAMKTLLVFKNAKTLLDKITKQPATSDKKTKANAKLSKKEEAEVERVLESIKEADTRIACEMGKVKAIKDRFGADAPEIDERLLHTFQFTRQRWIDNLPAKYRVQVADVMPVPYKAESPKTQLKGMDSLEFDWTGYEDLRRTIEQGDFLSWEEQILQTLIGREELAVRLGEKDPQVSHRDRYNDAFTMVVNHLRKANGLTVIDLSTPETKSLIKQRVAKEIELTKLLKVYGQKHPQVKAAGKSFEELREKLREKAHGISIDD